MDLHPDFKELLGEFARSSVDFVVVGAYAVAFHGRPRSTKDIDLVLAGSTENLARAAEALSRFGAPPEVVAGVRSLSPTEVVYLGRAPVRIDFLRTIEGVSAEDLFAHAATAEIDGVRLRIISLDDLIANKRAVDRPKDREDVKFLERVRAKRGVTR
jgi:predicted nucleotidyltransferase